MQRGANSVIFAALMSLLMTCTGIWAQPEQHHQLLYRNRSDNGLYVADALTGETTKLRSLDQISSGWSWSPDGHYILGVESDGERFNNYGYIYDMQSQSWLDDITFHLGDGLIARWSPDSRSIAFAYTIDETNAELRLISIDTGKHQILYRSSDGTRLNPKVVGSIWWSPNQSAILFVDARWQIGGSVNYLKLLNLETDETYQLHGAFGASYHPQWSPDGDWILIRLEKNYTNMPDGEEGDVYLFAASDGAKNQITYSPEYYESNLQWIDNGQYIQFSTYDDGPMTMRIALERVIQAGTEPLTFDLLSALQPTATLPVSELGSSAELSPSGHYVTFLDFFESEAGTRALYVAEPDGTNRHRLGEVKDPYYDIYGWRP